MALGVHEVDHVEHTAEALGQLVVGRDGSGGEVEVVGAGLGSVVGVHVDR